MVGSTDVIALIAYFIVGLIIGWGVLVIRDDLRIQKDNQWRRIRAAFLAIICILFAIAAFFVNTPGFLLASASCVAVLAYAARKRHKAGG